MDQRLLDFIFDGDHNLLWSDDREIVTRQDFENLERTKLDVVMNIKFYSATTNLEHPLTVHIEEATNTLEKLIEKVTNGVERLQKVLDNIKNIQRNTVKVTSAEKNNFESDTCTDNCIDWVALVLQEEKLRNSEEMVRKYAEVETDSSPIDWIEFTATVIQPKVLRDNHIEPSERNLYMLRVAAQGQDVFWVKHNRARQGYLRTGSMVPPHVSLYDVTTGTHTAVSSLCRTSRPLVLLAGSVS
jgi:hypothetical protein